MKNVGDQDADGYDDVAVSATSDQHSGFANYVRTLRRDLLKVSEAVGVVHPSLIGPDDVDVLNGVCTTRSVREVYGYEPGWGLPGSGLVAEIAGLMAPQVSATQPQAT